MSDSPSQPFLRTPALDPEGKRLAFVYGGDVWLADAAGGSAERLTAHQAYHSAPRFSPDGMSVAFTSGRGGHGEVYVLPLGGGPVRQLTFHDAHSSVEDWSPDGRWIYFSSGREQLSSAIYRVDMEGSTPALVYAEPNESLGQVQASPDGATLAFANLRDRRSRRGPNPFAPDEIWLGPSQPDYAALRMVAGPGRANGHPALAAPYAGRNCWPLWMPDGDGLCFVSDRDGNENLWLLPLNGEGPRQVTHFRDGRLLFPAIARRSGLIVFERAGQLWRFDLPSGETEPIPLRVRGDTKYTPVRVESWSRGFSELRLSPDGKKVAFVARGTIFADFADKETDRDLRSGPSFRVADTSGREGQLAWTPDSRGLVYISDRFGEDELFRYDFTASQETRLTSDLAPKRMPRVSPDGKWVAYISRDESIRLRSLTGDEERELCKAHFVLSADLCWSPDSRWVAFLAHDERYFSNVWVAPAAGGEPRQITFLSNLDGGGLLWSPDGQALIFTTEQYRAEAQIVRVDLRPPQPMFRESEFEKLFEGKATGDRGQGTGERQTSEKGEKAPEQESDRALEQEGEQPGTPAEPTEAPAEQRESEQPDAEKPQPAHEPAAPGPQPPALQIVFEGIERRLRFLTPMQMNASAEAISPDSKDLLFLAEVAGKVNLWSLPLDEPRAEQAPRQLSSGDGYKSYVQFAPDGRACFYLEDGQIASRKFPAGDGYVRLAARADVEVNFHRDKLQIFGEAWRALRDSFYDPTFRGQDWAAVRQQFLPLATGATTPGDLHTVINLMVGELRASHLGSGFNGWTGNDGYTGVLFSQSAMLEGQLRVERVLPESPAALVEHPPRPGEYLRAVNGTAIGHGVSLDRLLRRTVGRRVRLSFADAPEGGTSREILLRPIDADDYERLRYRDWSLANRQYVARISAGRLGYVHIEQMSYRAYQQFLADLDAETHGKDGVIVDVRYNSGGHTAPFIIDLLARRSTVRSGFRQRAGADASHLAGSRVLNKPTVLVTNERSASNTEMLSESYRRLGLGKVVGRPTAGAVIWTFSMRLLDNSSLRLPRFYVVTPEGEDLEGRGRPVDVPADRPLGEWALGRDQQLDAAVAALLGSLA